jgi:8-oxo-dGTP diphosphatase
MKKIEVVAAIIIFEKEILCMQRNRGKHEYLSYKYEFPGGKVEPGESRVDALKRELIEEMDIEVIVEEKDFFLTVQHQYPDFEITMHSYVCKVKNKEFIRKEHVDHKWLTQLDLLTLDWAPADIPIVDKIVGGALNI